MDPHFEIMSIRNRTLHAARSTTEDGHGGAQRNEQYLDGPRALTARNHSNTQASIHKIHTGPEIRHC